jgi:hypothetical protein
MGIKILALQEPALNFLNLTIASNSWSAVYPSTHAASPEKTRAITLISTTLNMDSWEQIEFPSGDVTAIQIKGRSGKLIIYNIYNDCKSNATIRLLTTRRSSTSNAHNQPETNRLHTIWLGDFNRHHPYWDDPNDERLFTNEALEEAEVLIEAVADAGLELILPSGIPTHVHNVTKKWTRLDQVFLSDHSLDLLIACDTRPDLRGIKTDHLPIITELNLGTSGTKNAAIRNFREVDWGNFKESLDKHLQRRTIRTPIRNQRQLDDHCERLTLAIKSTIGDTVPITKICDKSKRWWTKELSQMRKHANKLGRIAYGSKDNATHAVHEEHKKAVKLYEKTLSATKKQH